MEECVCREYTGILKEELVAALGCTEPIAIACACARAVKELGEPPVRMEIRCSGNIVKNVQGVTVPNSGGMKGIAAAAVLGAVGGDADRGLEVLAGITQEHVARTRQLLSQGYCECALAEGCANLYIEVRVFSQDGNVRLIVADRHTNITLIEKNGAVVFENACAEQSVRQGREILSVRGIIDYARSVDISDIEDVITRQIEFNERIAAEGLRGAYGLGVGRAILEKADHHDARVMARAAASAASDARMSGCALPVVINSGSGNQGLTVSLPVIQYAREMASPNETLIRALAAANLIAVLQKRYIGDLSAFCGAVSAAAGAAAGIVFLCGGGYEEISNAVTNTIGSVGGMICDGAKPSCSFKIAVALEAALLGVELGMGERRTFLPGEGIVKDDLEKTIASVGRVGRDGMRSTDVEILKIMLEKQ